MTFAGLRFALQKNPSVNHAQTIRAAQRIYTPILQESGRLRNSNFLPYSYRFALPSNA